MLPRSVSRGANIHEAKWKRSQNCERELLLFARSAHTKVAASFFFSSLEFERARKRQTQCFFLFVYIVMIWFNSGCTVSELHFEKKFASATLAHTEGIMMKQSTNNSIQTHNEVSNLFSLNINSRFVSSLCSF